MGKSMKKTSLIYIGICLVAVIVVGLSAAHFLTQNNKPKTTFEVLPIPTPQWDMQLDKPAAYMNVSFKNDGNDDQTNVTVRILGGFSNSSSQVPEELFLVTTKSVDVIKSGETVTMPRIFNFGWYFFYRVEVSSTRITKETFDQWVEWRSWTVPQPT